MLSSHEERQLIPWTGDVPERWKVMKGKDLFVVLNREVLASDGTVTVFRDGAVTLRSKRRLTGFTEATYFSGYQGVEPGDLVIHQMDAFAGAVGVSDSRGKCSPVCAVCKPRAMANQFYYSRLIKVMAWSGWISALSKGIRVRSTDFRFSVFKQQWLPVPPLEEQGLIVRYLDHAELRIAKAIAAKQDVVRLLREARLAMISETVIAGNGADVARIESGIPGVGSVPAHWRIRRAKYVWNAVDVRSVIGTEERLTVSSASGIVPRSSKNVTMFEAATYVGHKVVQPNDLVINSLWAWAGGLGVSAHHGLVSPVYGVYRLRDDAQCDPEFMHNLLRSNACQWQFQVRSKGIWRSRLSITDDAFFDMPLPLPPLEEQRTIAATIRTQTANVDKAIASVLDEIALLKEYRTRLISDVVTGKLDVRDEAAKLPEIDPMGLAAVTVSENGDDEEATDED